MSGLRFEQASVEVGQVFFFNLVAQQTESLARARFDKACDEQAVYGPLRLTAAHKCVQTPAVISRTQTPKRNVPLAEQATDHFKVLEFLMNNADHFITQFVVVDVR